MITDHFVHREGPPTAPPPGGLLRGKRVALHPSISVRGWPTEAGTRALAGFTALENAAPIDRLQAAGALLAGSTTMDELGLGVSRDGAGPAVAAGDADLALVVDMAGESRIAAAKSGLAGFKPSFGIVSRYGVIGLAPSMESVGILARHPGDILDTLAVISGDDERDCSLSREMPDFKSPATLQADGIRLGVPAEAAASLDPEGRERFKEALSVLERAGCVLQELNMGEFELFPVIHSIIGSVEASSSAGKFDGVRYGHRVRTARDWNDMYLRSRGESFGTFLKTWLFQGAWFQFENYGAFENACRIRARLTATMDSLFGERDFIALPTVAGTTPVNEPAHIAGLFNLCRFTVPANVTGLPALHLPGTLLGMDGGSSIQVLGRRLDDPRLLAWASRMVRLLSGEMT